MATIGQIRRGYRYDPESSRETSRLRTAWAILKAAGIDPEIRHGDTAINQGVDFGRPRHRCADNCRPEWPEWVTNEMLQNALDLANKTVSARGKWARSL